MERIHLADPDVGQHAAFISPVDLALPARDHLEPTMQPGQRIVLGLPKIGRDPRPRLGDIHFHRLVVPGEPMLGDQPLVDHTRLQRDLPAQPGIHHTSERVDHPRLRAHPRWRRRQARRLVGEVLLDRLPVMPGLPSD